MLSAISQVFALSDEQKRRRTERVLDRIFTPLPGAIDEARARASDAGLRNHVLEYLGGDIPSYFREAPPILYLARHIATPNFETLRWAHLVEPFGLHAVIGEDSEDTFVSHNVLKRALCKLSVCTDLRIKNGRLHEAYRNMTIADFNSIQHRPFSEIRTLWDEPLVTFHKRLCARFLPSSVSAEDDGAWVTRHHRGNLVEHYKHFLALFIAHGVLFEDYLTKDAEERKFVRDILEPAFRAVEAEFGVPPLIARLLPTSMESELFWLSYPKDVGAEVEECMSTRKG